MKVERILGFSAFLLIPFLGGNHLALLHFTIDRFWIETSFILLMLLSVVLTCYRGTGTTGNFYRFLIFFCPLFTVTLLSLIYTWSAFSTLNEINVLLWALAAAFLFLTTSDRDNLLKGLVAGASLSALCAVWQFLVLFPSLLEIYKSGAYAAILKDQHVPFSAFLNQNMLGGYCAAILPLALYFAFIKKQRIYFVAVCLISVGLILSVSRLAVLACIPSFVFVTVLVFKDRGFKGILSVAACIGTAVVLVFLIIYGPYTKTNDHIKSTLEGKIQRSYSEASTLNFRTDIWKTGIKAFVKNPFVGYGAGSFVFPYQKYYEGKRYTKVAHGTFVKIAVELGILGILSFLWFCSGVLKNLHSFEKDRGTITIGLSALVVFLFGLFDFSFDTAAHVVTFFCLSSVSFTSRPPAFRAPSARIVSILLILPILLSFVFTAKANSSRRFVEDASMYKEAGSAQEMQESLIAAHKIMPWNNDASIHLISLLSSSYLQEKDAARKENVKLNLLTYVQEAERSRDKDAEVFFVIGNAKRAMGDGVASCDHMNEALYYHPSSACYAYWTAACYAGHGQIEKAQSIVKSMKNYYDNYHRWKYPDGVIVHKIKDLEAQIELRKGNREGALSLMRQNLESARQNQFVLTDWRARQSLPKNQLIAELEQRIRSFEAKGGKDERKTVQNGIH